jgi:predicted Zn-dependent protease
MVDRKGEAFCASCAALLKERTPAAPRPTEGRT